MGKNNWDKLISFVHKRWDVGNDIILSRSTGLQEDLGIEGDDADEFIYLFSKEFKVNIENINLSKYFDHNIETNIFSFLFAQPKMKKNERELTLGDLENAIKTGELADKFILQKDIEWNMLINFINKFWPFNNNIELKQSTTLSGDLGIGGDDADELIYEFSKEFNININDFTISKYFEGYSESTFLTNILSNKKFLKERELTLGDMENAMKIGKLADEFILKYS